MSEHQYEVSFHGDNLENERTMRGVLGPIADRIKRHIIVSNPHGSESGPMASADTLYIRFWSVPGNRKECRYREVLGFELTGGQNDGLRPPEIGLSFTDEKGITFAELVDDTYYVLFDLPHGHGEVGALLAKVMGEYLKFAELSDEEKQKAIDEVRQKQEDSTKVFLKEMFAGQIDRKLRERDEVIKQTEQYIKSYQNKIASCIRDRDSALADKARLLEEKKKPVDDMYEQRYNRLLELSATHEIRRFGDEIFIPVGQIDVEFRGKVYDIGNFTIAINVSDDNSDVRCINNTRTVRGYYHPHVEGDGDCCLGNISSGVGSLLGQMEYDVLVPMMIEFLKSVNPSGWYISVEHWPVKGEPYVEEKE